MVTALYESILNGLKDAGCPFAEARYFSARAWRCWLRVTVRVPTFSEALSGRHCQQLRTAR